MLVLKVKRGDLVTIGPVSIQINRATEQTLHLAIAGDPVTHPVKLSRPPRDSDPQTSPNGASAPHGDGKD